MTAADFSAGDFVNQLAIAGATSCLELVTLSTGVPGSKKINVRAFAVYSRFVYASDWHRLHEANQHLFPPLNDLARPVKALANSFDCAFVDPWHSLNESLFTIELAIIGVRNGGTIVIHDCHPRESPLRNVEPPEVYHQPWVGSTWMAWSLLTSDLPTKTGFMTIDSDFGVGVLQVPSNTRDKRQLIRAISSLRKAVRGPQFVAPEWAPDPDHLRLVRPDHPLVVGWT